MTSAEKAWYYVDVVAKSMMEFDISKTQRCPKDTSYLFLQKTHFLIYMIRLVFQVGSSHRLPLWPGCQA